MGEDVRAAVERGDLRASTWRMVAAPGGDYWRGDVRHVKQIARLLDVTVTSAPADVAAAAELRSQPDPAAGREDTMAETAEQTTTTTTEPEDRSTTSTTGGLQVDDRVAVTHEPTRGLAGCTCDWTRV